MSAATNLIPNQNMNKIITLNRFFLHQFKSSKISSLIIIISVLLWGFFFPPEANVDYDTFGFFAGIYLFLLAASIMLLFNHIAFDNAFHPIIVKLGNRHIFLSSLYLATFTISTIGLFLLTLIGLLQFPLLRTNLFQLVTILFRCLFLAASAMILLAHTTRLVAKYHSIRLLLIILIGIKAVTLLLFDKSLPANRLLETMVKPFFWAYETAVISLLTPKFTPNDWLAHGLVFVYSSILITLSYQFFNSKDLSFPETG